MFVLEEIEKIIDKDNKFMVIEQLLLYIDLLFLVFEIW